MHQRDLNFRRVAALSGMAKNLDDGVVACGQGADNFAAIDTHSGNTVTCYKRHNVLVAVRRRCETFR